MPELISSTIKSWIWNHFSSSSVSAPSSRPFASRGGRRWTCAFHVVSSRAVPAAEEWVMLETRS